MTRRLGVAVIVVILTLLPAVSANSEGCPQTSCGDAVGLPGVPDTTSRPVEVRETPAPIHAPIERGVFEPEASSTTMPPAAVAGIGLIAIGAALALAIRRRRHSFDSILFTSQPPLEAAQDR